MKLNQVERDLISAMSERDPASAASLYDQYAGTLFKIICCSVGDPKVAATVLEETMLFIWNNCNDCSRQDKRLLLWMAGIARQMARKYVESRHEIPNKR